MSLRDQWTFLPPQPKIARGMSRVVKMPSSVSLTVEKTTRMDDNPPPGVRGGSQVWLVKGKLDVFPLLGTPVVLEAVFYLPPNGTRLFFTNLKSRETGRCEVVVVRSLDHLLDKEGTNIVKIL